MGSSDYPPPSRTSTEAIDHIREIIMNYQTNKRHPRVVVSATCDVTSVKQELLTLEYPNILMIILRKPVNIRYDGVEIFDEPPT